MAFEERFDLLFPNIPNLLEIEQEANCAKKDSTYPDLTIFSTSGQEFAIWTEAYASNIQVSLSFDALVL